ncbi:MAG TPA: GNAT family N-acetyltransferase [Salinivirgaceae bacterium]|nr:GNAT family N-acetyltransferase [Salinivirgaceae bacterium]
MNHYTDMVIDDIKLRTNINNEDFITLPEITKLSGYFYDEEVEIVVEIVNETYKNPDCGYMWVIAEIDNKPVGFATYGKVPGSLHSWDLYWIVTGKSLKGCGIGKKILNFVEAEVVKNGGKILIAETSGRELYADTRAFYIACGYTLEAVIKEFYGPYDDKIFYVKRLST